MNKTQLKQIVEAALMCSESPLDIHQLKALFDQDESVETNTLKRILSELENDYASRGICLKRVSSGWRFQSRDELSQWLERLQPSKKIRFSKAALEILAMIAYKQPVTRGDIEAVRGVAVSSNILRVFMELDWIRVAGHKDVPGRPALYVTTKAFLDAFNLKSIEELPQFDQEVLDFQSRN